MKKGSYRVTEIFYSIQGEGNNVGRPAVFVRFQGCAVESICPIKCDTEFNTGKRVTAKQIEKAVRGYLPHGGYVILTGGESLTQYDNELALHLTDWFVCAETSGAFKPKAHLDWVSVSPKVAPAVLKRNFEGRVDELRYVLREGQEIPVPPIESGHLFISPEWDGANTARNIAWCVGLVKTNPEWRLSVQTHKLLGLE
jgi:7-carboxy-7-deazaguanine synthase